MPVNSALAGADVTNLNAGPSVVKTYLSPVANAVYATAQVLSTINFPVAGISVYNTSANWLTVPRDATVVITDGGSTVRGYYRTRLDQAGSVTTASLIYINEIGQGDPGMIAQDIRNTSIQPNDLITVYSRWDAQSVLPRIVYSGGTTGLIFEDFDRLIAGENSTPGPATAILVRRSTDTGNGMPGAWAWRVDSGQTYATLNFFAFDSEWPTAGAVTYTWTVPASWTSVTGAATQTLSARVPAQATNHILKLVVSEANGGSTTRYIPIWVYDFSTYSPMSITQVNSDMRDRTGRRMTVTLNDNALASIPDGTLCCVWNEATWNGNNIPSASKHFNGFILRETSSIPAPGLRSAEIEIVGPTYIMDQLNANSQYMTATTGTPANWQQIKNTLSFVDFVMYWIWSRRTTLCYVFDYCPLGTVSTTWRMPAWDIPTGSALSQMQTLAERVGANVGADSGGQIVIRQHPSLTDYSFRGVNVVTRDSLTAALYSTATVERNPRPRYRRTRGEGFLSDGTTATPVLSDAPDTVPGQGMDEDTMGAQIVNNQTELNQRTGNRWSLINNPYNITVELPYNRDVIEPAQMPFVSITLPASLNPRGVGFTKNVVPFSIEKRYENNGATLTLSGEFETAGLPGRTVQVPTVTNDLFGSYSTAPVDYLLPTAAPATTNSWGSEDTSFMPAQLTTVWTNGGVWQLSGFPSSLTWTDKSPGAGLIAAVGTTVTNKGIFDPYNLKRFIVQYDSGFLYTNDITAATPVWNSVTGFLPSGYHMTKVFNAGAFPNYFSDSLTSAGTRQNYFGWLCTNGTLTKYQYTTDNFATFNTTTVGTGISGNSPCGGVAISSFNAGVVFVAGADGVVYKSTDWGASFSGMSAPYNTDPSGTSRGGPIDCPYTVGGANNTTDKLYWDRGSISDAGDFNIVNVSSTAVGISASGIHWAYQGRGQRAFQTYTLNGSKVCFASDYRQFYNSTDGGTTWAVTDITSFAAWGTNARQLGLNGWPTNPNFLLVYGQPGALGYTNDRGVTWSTIDMSTPTGAGAGWCTDAQGYLGLYYPTGGVH